jgi:hypothetical protein
MIDFYSSWSAFVLGGAFAMVGVVQTVRQLRAQEAWDGERPDAKHFRRSAHPKAYWSIIAMYVLMAMIGFCLILYSFWGLQP